MLEGDVPSAKLASIVEPWFPVRAPTPLRARPWRVGSEMGSRHGTQFYKSVDEVKVGGGCMALISGGPDNPRLLKEVIEAHLINGG